jgi:hypothetical protein
VLMLVVPLLHLHYPAAAQMDDLRTTMKNSMGSRRSLSSQLPVELNNKVSYYLTFH